MRLRFVLRIMLFIGCLLYLSPHPPAFCEGRIYDDLFSVTFLTEKDGWACGRWGTILHTEDGGNTWVRQVSGTTYTLSSLSFIDAKTGWAVGNQGTILHTKDGGKTWEKQKSPVTLFLMGVQFVSPLKGFIVTEQTTILATEDGGKTWIKRFSDMDYILRSVSFCDAQNGWAVGEYGYIYHTSNGGKTWEKQAGNFRVSPESGDVEAGLFLFKVVAIDPKTAWAVGIDGYVTRTTDGGKNWDAVKTPASKTHLFGLAVTKTGTIVIAGNGTLLVSPDHGKTWMKPEVTPPIKYGWMYAVTSRGGPGFVATGWQGAIYAGNGASWKCVSCKD